MVWRTQGCGMTVRRDEHAGTGAVRIWQRFRSNRGGLMGLAIVVVLLLLAVFAPLVAGNVPVVCRYQGNWYAPGLVETVRRIPLVEYVVEPSRPFGLPSFDAKANLTDADEAYWPLIPYGPTETSSKQHLSPSSTHWFGTDEIGRDLASRMVHGTTVSMTVGFVAMGIAALIGLTVGGWAGYAGGRVDAVLSRLIEIVTCFPVLFLILAVMVWLEPNIVNVMVIIGLTRWTGIARLTRGEFLKLKEQEFVLAARACGAGPVRIALRHLMPIAAAPALVMITFGVAQTILIEAALSWLGFGVQPPNPSWGNILRSAYVHLRTSPHMVYPPCVAIFLAVLAYNLVGDALRDAIDPRTEMRQP